jgi:hypothetical protein
MKTKMKKPTAQAIRRAEALRATIDRNPHGPVFLCGSRRAVQAVLRASPLLARRIAATVIT